MATDTPVKFDGTKKREKGGNSAPKISAEQHDSPRNKGKRVSQDAKISRCLNDVKDSTLDDSKVTGKPREIGPAEKVRRANNLGARDSKTNLGRGKSATVTVG